MRLVALLLPVLASFLGGCTDPSVDASDEAALQIADGTRPFFDTVERADKHADGSLVVRAGYGGGVISPGQINEPFSATITMAADGSSCLIEYRFRSGRVTEERSIHTEEADALRYAIEFARQRVGWPSSAEESGVFYAFSARLKKFATPPKPFVAMDVPLEGRKLDGVLRMSASLTSFDRPGAARETVVTLSVTGTRWPKASGRASVYEVATNKLVASETLVTMRTPTELGGAYTFRFPGLLSPSVEYVVVSEGVVHAMPVGEVRTAPVHGVVAH